MYGIVIVVEDQRLSCVLESANILQMALDEDVVTMYIVSRLMITAISNE